MHVKKGDWVSFVRNNLIVIAEIAYVPNRRPGQRSRTVITTQGEVFVESIIEIRETKDAD